MPSSAPSFDVAIVGGGPAGLSAAIWLARYLHSVVVIDSGDPRSWDTRGINGYLGLPGIKPPELRARGRESCRDLGVELVDGCVCDVDRLPAKRFAIALSDGRRFESARMLLAYGLRDEWPSIDGLERVYGKTAHVCPDCDGREALNTRTVVIGAGRRAVGMALALTTWTPHIVICTNGQPADMTQPLLDKLDALNIPVIEQKIRRALSDNREVTALEFEDGLHLDCERLFFTLGQYAADNLGKQLTCKRDELGRIECDAGGHTSVEHVYAAGDIAAGSQLAIAAAASGATAAIAIHHSLLPDERRLD